MTTGSNGGTSTAETAVSTVTDAVGGETPSSHASHGRARRGVNGWGFLVLVLLLLLLGGGVWYYYMGLMEDEVTERLLVLEGEIAQQQDVLIQERRSEQYMKFKVAQALVQQHDATSWERILTELIGLFDTLQRSGATDTLLLDDFTFYADKVTLRGRVSSIRQIYITDGLLDRMAALPFVVRMDVPFYREVGRAYEFILEATISHESNS